MSLHIPNMELKSLRIGEGGLPRREVERGGARGEGEAPAGAAAVAEGTQQTLRRTCPTTAPQSQAH